MSSLLSLAGNAAPTGFYDFPIEQSLRFEDGDSPRLTRALSHNRKTFTISFWFKRANLGRMFLYGRYISGTTVGAIEINPDDQLDFYDYATGYRFQLKTTRAFRDVGAWYNVTLSVDTTQSTASNRVKMYINGVQETTFVSETYPSQNLDSIFGDGGTHAIGTEGTNNRLFFDGYLADWNFIDGQALDPTSFGEFKSGIWIPKDVTGLTYGSGGYLLEFADSGAIGDDTSGNTNDWTANNLAATDVVPDSPTNNFPTIIKGFNQNVSEGNLKVERSSNANNHMGYFSTMGMKTGKWYAEVRYVDAAIDTVTFGVAETNERFSPSQDTTAYVGGSRSGISANTYVDWATFGVEAKKYSTYNGTNTSYGVAGVSGDIFMLAVDMDNNKFWVGKNGTWMASGNPAAGTNPTHEAAAFAPENPMVFVGSFYAGRATDIRWNFGQDSTFMGARAAGGNADENGYGDFAYPVPSGFLSLCSANLPKGAIDTLADETPEDYFNTVLYSGNSTNNTPITVGFEPSMTWIKTRNVVRDHRLMDAVRGATAGIYPNLTNAEGASPLLSFDSDGFTLNNTNNYNNTGETYASWNWKANGAGVSNTDGSITSTVSVGATSQQNWFSIVKYTGTGGNDSYGHGLGVAPNMIITKDMTDPANWAVYVSDIGTGKYLQLNLTAGTVTNSVIYPSVSSTTIGVGVQGDGSITNTSGDNYISYCFANAEGLCKVGTYTGNSSADGSFIYTGFRPAYLLYKQTTAAANWEVIDNTRNPYNVSDARLFPSNSSAENTAETVVDLLSNGFKARDAYGGWNFSGQSYIYLAIAEQPFKYANAR